MTIFGKKKFAENVWQIFGKWIFGNIFQIWQHLATVAMGCCFS